jgi:hypothetical protein
VRRHSVSDVPLGKNRNTPVLVHCGAGVGRTGVTIACDVLLTSLDHNVVSIFKFAQSNYWANVLSIINRSSTSRNLLITCASKGCLWCRPLPSIVQYMPYYLLTLAALDSFDLAMIYLKHTHTRDAFGL